MDAAEKPFELVAPPDPATEPDPKADWLEAFDDFWRDYPRRVGRLMAIRAWLKIRPWNQTTCDAIFAGLDRSKRYWSDHDTEPEYIPHASAWLNQERWEDELE